MAMRIAVFAAMPQETGPILKLNPGWRSAADGPFPISVHRSPEREVLLVETGIGPELAGRAARQLVAMTEPDTPIDLMLSVGFAGALSPDLLLGQPVWSAELAVFDDASRDSVVRYRCSTESGVSTNALGFFGHQAPRPVRFVTVDRLRSKAELARVVMTVPAVTEMETTSIAEVAHTHAIPFMGLRTISDELNLEIELNLDSIVDPRGRIRLAKLMLAVLRRPRRAWSLPALYLGSKLAGRNLARVLGELLAASEADLRALAGPPRPVQDQVEGRAD
jgi:nucleoside phosphorylase